VFINGVRVEILLVISLLAYEIMKAGFVNIVLLLILFSSNSISKVFVFTSFPNLIVVILV
jgi:hypothetical protein